MRQVAIGLLSMLCAAPAAAQDAPPWEGYWAADPAWCARAGQVGDETPDWYGRDGLFGLEWSCDIDQVRPTGLNGAWLLATTCLDAGEAYADRQIFLVTPEDRLLIIGETGVTAELVRCREDGQ